MNYHRDNGMRWRDAKDYVHYQIIAKEFEKARRAAWASIMNTPEVQLLREQTQERKIQDAQTTRDTLETILGIRK